MLLYARTTESIHPDNEYMMDGNKISVKTLDLNREFREIKKQLEDIIDCDGGKLQKQLNDLLL